MNSDTEAAWHFHNGTKHPNGNLLSRFHHYNPAQRPSPYKIYKDTQTIKLALDKSPHDFPALRAISDIIKQSGNAIPDLNTLARILYFSCGITKKINFGYIGDVEFRAAACTGALYHIEIYVACGEIPGLDAGVYHFDPKEMKLDVLRKGDYRRVLAEASGNDPFVEVAPLTLVFSDIFTRNSVKYQTREYRHAFWDCGTILANTFAISTAHKLPSKVVLGFVDDSVNFLLDLNTEKEVSLALVPIGFSDKIPKEAPQVSKLNLKTKPLSNYDYDDPEIQKIHQNSSLKSIAEVEDWKKIRIERKTKKPISNAILLRTDPDNKSLTNPIESVIIKRGSTREFARKPISFEELSTIIYYSTREIESDFTEPALSLVELYLIVNDVDGLKQGSYFFHREKNSLELLKKGNFRRIAGYLGLDQDLSADCSAALFFMSDLNLVLEKFGNRGYRAAQLEASIMGGRCYLASYAQGLGVSGLTFYDDAVTEFFSPHAKDKSVMFMVVLGKKQKNLY